MQTTYSTYFGINKGISPDIALLHIFLGYYFKSSKTREDIVKLIDSRVATLESNPLIVCKETDVQVRKNLLENMSLWIQEYSFATDQRGRQPIPYHLDLIYNATKDRTLRLLHMLYPDRSSLEAWFEKDQDLLKRYLYPESDPSKKGIYSSIVDTLYNIITLNEDNIDRTVLVDKKDYSSIINESITPQINILKIGILFRKALSNHLTGRAFQEYDAFRRINSLMLLVNLFLTLYTIYRSMDQDSVYILVKGSSEIVTKEGGLHTAAIGCFSDIRERVFHLSEEFYMKSILKQIDDAKTLKMRSIDIDTSSGKRTIKIGNNTDSWETIRDNIVSSRKKNELDRIIIDYLDLNNISDKIVRVRDLAKAFVDYSKKRSSSVRKVSSIFSTQGQQAKFVFPKNSTHKYYGISSELIELLLKLCLCEREVDYLTLDDFLLWLEDEYGIYIAYSDRIVNYLKSRSIRVPSFSEFEQNVNAIIHTLDSINAIQKMSDKSYIVHDSGKVGAFGW